MFADSRDMRALHAVGLVVVASFLAAACGDANTGSSGLRRRGVPAPGEQVEHDDDSEGANDVDPGNPNANAPPPAPGVGGAGAPQYNVALGTNIPASDMDSSTTIPITITPTQAFTNSVAVTVTGLPANVTADPLTIAVNGTAAAQGTLTLRVAPGAVASAPNTGYPITVVAAIGAAQATAPANFKVNPKVTLRIPMNINALRAAGAGTVYRNEWGAAYGTAPVALRTQVGNGIVVNVFNADSVPHVIHGANGFAHGNDQLPAQPNAFELQDGVPRVRTLNVGANTNGYMHEGGNGPSVSFRMSVAAGQ